MHPLLIFVRHGETPWNREGKLQGHRDIPLNDHGRSQAKRNGQIIAEHYPDIHEFDFVGSPLERAKETMEIVRLANGLDPAGFRFDNRLREISFGHWEGMTMAELRETHPELIKARDADKWGFEPPQGESYHDLADRVGNWFAELTRPTVAVAHGGVGRVLRKLLLDLDPQEVVSFNFPQDQILILDQGRENWL